MKIIIDRFENEFAVAELENGETVAVPKILFPSNAKEGSVINITCDDDETEKRRETMKNKMNAIFRK